MLNGTVTQHPSTPSQLCWFKPLSHETNGSEVDYTMATDDVWEATIDNSQGESWIHSQMPLRVVMWRGDGGLS